MDETRIRIAAVQYRFKARDRRDKLRIMSIKALIAGCAGPELNEDEVQLFKNERPWGFILFARNIESPEQVQALTAHMRECVGRSDAPILIDEEGGRVQRLRPPHWCSNPPGRILGEVFQRDPSSGQRAAYLLARLIAHDLHQIGVNVDCLPILDIPLAGAHDVIGDRAYGSNPQTVATLGAEIVKSLLRGGVLPIIKHIPGHGRAFCDSHHDLPRVDATLETLKQTDFEPFKALNKVAMAMTAHIIYDAIDPDHPATTSPLMINEIIRGYIGFDGLLMSDDVSMNALSGDYAQRTQSIFAAGCDIVLHCNGLMEEMVEVAAVTPELTGASLRRAEFALSQLQPADDSDIAALRHEFDQLTNAGD